VIDWAALAHDRGSLIGQEPNTVNDMARWIQTADDGQLTEIRDEEPDDASEWIEITELAYMSDAAPDGMAATRYYKPEADEPDGGWDIESETIGKRFHE